VASREAHINKMNPDLEAETHNQPSKKNRTGAIAVIRDHFQAVSFHVIFRIRTKRKGIRGDWGDRDAIRYLDGNAGR
jgi:hypothetical protein